ncbi:MAG: four helix bundle protein [Ignavibacteria bacterium GWA2_35_9]|nr:MAG: four helix bundle protein [Ignavibacteria bacterium GWA2_35_9]OGU43874.1 MAG: four helix bundle protein [Ignavibacteria bacterium GWB2_36_8]OGU53784.1 MAG: four helix bundle protein [Ignavibacteria bacterium GWC2_36_12]
MLIKSHFDLDVFQVAFKMSQEIFLLSKKFPKEESYSLTDQIRRSSRSVCANTAEAFRKRIYPKSFISKLNDAEAESAETQVWLNFAKDCNYLNSEKAIEIINKYENIIGKLVSMQNQSERWNPLK